ncbi:hypothetical protein [Lactobacillus terrae]|uniref:hypothetical protein n=1 Tax=Lactobacillus terrae TaxID=2269374 RepID=UPI000C1B61AB|nr:hypothetical protein [Lactobacillus terrae]
MKINGNFTISKKVLISTVSVITVLIIIGAFFVNSAKFRDMSTSDNAKASEFVGWSNSANIPFSATSSLSGDRFIITPQNKDIVDNVFDLFKDPEANSQENEQAKNAVIWLSKKVTDEWGDKYYVVMTPYEDQGQVLYQARDGKLF